MSQLNDFIATYIARMPSIRWVDIVEILLIAFLMYHIPVSYTHLKTVDCIKSDDDSDPNQNLVDYFRENTLQELASTSTEKEGLGIAQMLYEQMKRNYNL